MYVYSLVFLCCVIFVSDGRRLRKRSVNCTDGTYQHKGKTCCLCPKGYRVLSDCSATDGNYTDCELCDSDSYMDHPNSDHSCLPCKICNPNANMQTKVTCSRYSNTVCKCLEDYYCDRGDHCKFCKPCGKCENKVKTKCTETNNTVCEDATPLSGGAITIMVLMPIVLIIVVGGVLFIYIRRRNRQRRDKVKEETETTDKLLQGIDVDVDINEYLPEIGEYLSWKVMKRVAQHSGMTTATIDNHEGSHPTDARQRTDGLLRDWFQTQGLYKAYPALIKSLYAIKERRTAEEIKQIVEKGEAKKREINRTGHL